MVHKAPLAIVGMGCRLPGAADLDAYWRLLIEGRSAIGELPPDRLNQDLYYDPQRGVRGKTYTNVGGVVEHLRFDPLTCPLPARTLAHADVAQIAICQIVADACRHAGWNPFDIPHHKAGVYVGHTTGGRLGGELTYGTCVAESAEVLRELAAFRALGEKTEAVLTETVRRLRSVRPRRTADGHPTLMASLGAAIIADAFDLDGPAMALDSACSSSLQALALAARDLWLDQVDLAIVGGASYLGVDGLVLFSNAQSATAGRSCPFDVDADGFVGGEGQVALLVKRLDRALSDGDRVHAVIRGIGVSSDGRGKSLWAPLASGQRMAIRRAYGEDVDMGRLQYVEAHATSTQAGDVTELSALAEVLQEVVPAGTRIPVGGVKANIGHTLETAGLAGLVKTVLAMQHGVVPRQINVEQLNPKLPWDQLPLFVPLENHPWSRHADGHPRRAAVNAFGVGGLNVHVVLDEHQEEGAGVRPRTSASPSASAARAAVTTAEEEEAVAVIGLGSIFPGANTVEAFWDLLMAGRDPKCEVPPDRWNRALSLDPTEKRPWHARTTLGGFITDFDYDWKRHKIPPKQIARADPLQFMILEAVDAALRQTGCDIARLNRERIGVVVGTMFGSDFSSHFQVVVRLPEFQQVLADVLRGHGVPDETIARVLEEYGDLLVERLPMLLDETGSFTPSSLASRITKSFDLHGGAVSIDAGQNSSLAALAAAQNMLRVGDCDMVICAAGNRAMGLPVYEVLSLTGDAATGNPKAPFDQHAGGIVPGEGVGVLLLKRLADARRDGDQVRAVIRGLATAGGHSQCDTLRQSISRALRQSGLDAADVAAVEVASVGLEHDVENEYEAIRASQEGRQASKPLVLGSTCSQLGYLQSAAGMAGVIKSILAMEHQRWPATWGLTEPVSWLKTREFPVRLALESQVLNPAGSSGRLVCGVNSWTAAGGSYHLLLEAVPARVTEEPQARSSSGVDMVSTLPSWRIVRVAGRTPAELEQHARACVAAKDSVFHRAAEQVFARADRFRLAVVAQHPDDLAEKLTLAIDQGLMQCKNPDFLERKGIYLGERPASPPRVAFMFSGQGAQYPQMLKALIAEFPPAARTMRELDATLTRLKYPDFADLAWDHAEALGQDIWRTQLAILAASTILDQSLKALAIRPDVVSCLSYGEFPALVCAGAWKFAAAAQATDARCAIVERCCHTPCAMLAVPRGQAEMEQHIREVSDQLFVANITAEDQTVIGGEVEAIQQLARHLRKKKIASRKLTVPHAYHTPLMQGVTVPFRKILATIPLKSPETPLLSSVSHRYVTEPNEIRDNLAVQMREPVDYWQIFRQLVEEGVGAFVEVGPDSVLTDLHRKLLASMGRTAPVVASDNKSRGGGLAQLLCVQACLECCGALERAGEAEAHQVSEKTRAKESDPRVGSDLTTSRPADAPRLAASAEHGLSLLEMRGSPYDLGLAEGRQQRDQIRQVLRRYADLAGQAWNPLPPVDVGDATLESLFGADGLAELQGIADGAEVSRANVIAHNLQLYSAHGAGCFHFAVSARANSRYGMLHCANDDVPLALLVRCPLGRAAQVRHPEGGIPHVTFAVAGQLAGAMGVNAHGLAVTSTILLDRRLGLRPDGLLHGVIVKRILEGARDIDAALEIIEASPRASAWSLCLSHQPSDEICCLEYDGQSLCVERRDAVVAANHSMILQSGGETPAHSRNRLARWEMLMASRWPHDVDPTIARKVLRDQFDVARGRLPRKATMNSIRRTDNQQSVVFQPGSNSVWVTRGPQDEGRYEGTADEDQFHRLDLSQLLGPPAPPPAGPSKIRRAVEPAGEHRSSSLTNEDRNGPFQPEVCSRYVMRMVARAPSRGGDSPADLTGTFLIVGQNAVGRALQTEIKRRGGSAVELPVTDSVAEAQAALEQVWRQSAVPHLLLVTPYDDDARTDLRASAWSQRRQRGLMIPYVVCQRWLQLVTEAGLLEQASIVAVTNLGGDFGFSSSVPAAEGGALVGLVKALRIEVAVARNLVGKFRTKAIDAPPDLPADVLAQHVLDELAGDALEVEVAYVGTQRFVARPFAQSHCQLPATPPPPGGTWVVTGGARGITAAIARELGRRLQLKIHVLGSGELPQIDPAWRDLTPDGLRALRTSVCKEASERGEVPIRAWQHAARAIEIDRNMREFEAAGVRVTYHRCDVSDRSALADVLAEIRRQDGPVQGIIHGAGVEQACAFHKKQPESVSRTIAAKVDGAAALMDLTREDPLQFFIGFGSISGRFGGAGQTDYCLANEMLSKLVDWYRHNRPECHANTIMWHSWDEIGMAARPESKSAPALRGMKFLSPAEGIGHMAAELWCGLPERETMITDPELCARVYPDMAEYAQQPLPDPLIPHAPRTEDAASATNGDSKPTAAPTVARRYVLRLRELADVPVSSPTLPAAGGAIILGDNADASALQTLLVEQNIQVHHVPAAEDPEAIAAQLARIWEAGPAPHLFVMTSRDCEATRIDDARLWSARRQSGIVGPFLFVRHWLQLVERAGLMDRASLAAATSLGGDFGIGGRLPAPEGGALAGLFKSIAREQSRDQLAGPIVKVIDAPEDVPSAELAANMLRELTLGREHVEVTWSSGRRAVPIVLEAESGSPRGEPPQRQSVWVVTGGARGITASCALALAEKYQLRLHVIGRCPAGDFPDAWQGLSRQDIESRKRSFLGGIRDKQRLAEWEAALRGHEIASNLQRFERAGVAVTYHACDVRDARRLGETLDQIRQQDGPISGIIHGAGTIGGFTRLVEMRQEDLEEAIDVKATALLNLLALTRQDPLRWVIGFGSIIGRYGAAGRSDYVMASELLCKLIAWYRAERPDCRAVGFHWHPWADVGMMTSGAAAGVRHQMSLMPPEEGNHHFLAELEADVPEREVVIVDPAVHAAYAAVPADSNDSWPSDMSPDQRLPMFPLLDAVVAAEQGQPPLVQLHLDPVHDPFLREHRFRDRPMMPIVMASEAFAETAALLAGQDRHVVGLRDMEVVNALRLFSDDVVTATVRARPDGSSMRCELASRFQGRNKKITVPERVHMRAVVELGDRGEPGEVPELDRPPWWYDVWYPDAIAIYHGPPFRCLRMSALDDNGAWGRILAPLPEALMGNRRGRSFIIPAAVLDACFYECGILVWFQDDGAVAIPQSFRRLRLWRQPSYREDCIVRVKRTVKLSQSSEFDFTLYGEDGGVILQVEGYQAVVVPTRAMTGEAV